MGEHDVPRVTLRPTRDRSPLRQVEVTTLARSVIGEMTSAVVAILAGVARVAATAAQAARTGAQIIGQMGDRRARPTAPRPPLELTGAPGHIVRGKFVVHNDRVARLSGALACTDWYGGDDVRPARDVIRCRPASVDLAPGGFQPVEMQARITSEFARGVPYLATLFIAGSRAFRQPVRLVVSTSDEPPRR